MCVRASNMADTPTDRDRVFLDGLGKVMMCAHKHGCNDVVRFIRAKHGNKLLVYIKEQLDEAVAFHARLFTEVREDDEILQTQ